MKPLFYFLIISIVVLFSCNSNDHNKISLVGKWYQVSFKEGYAEFEFHPKYVIVFSHHIGYSKIDYKIEDDSLKYPSIGYSAKISPQSDSIINFIGYKVTSTLVRWNESTAPFESVPGPIKNKEDSLKYKSYLDKFNERAKQAYLKEGIYLQEE